MQCDACGKKEATVVAAVEGAELSLCDTCAEMGKVLRKIRIPVAEKKAGKLAPKKEVIKVEIIESIVANYAQIVRNARSKKGLTQEDFAKTLNEKSSVLAHIENGKLEPSLSLARKLERLLHVKLVEESEEKEIAGVASSSDAVTIGDIIKIKKR